MEELQRDPEFTARQASRQEKFRKLREQCDAVSQPILAKLALAGFTGSSIKDVGVRYVPLPSALVDILLEALPTCPIENLQETIVRAIGGAAEAFDGRPLRDLFEGTNSEAVRFAVLNTIAMVRPHSIDAWIRERLRSNSYYLKTLTDLGYTDD